MPHSHTNLLYHVVFATQGRLPLPADEVRPELYKYMSGILHRLRCIAIEINGTENHVHVLIKIRPDVPVSEVLQKLKAGSSGWLSRAKKMRFAWQDGYGAFTVSKSQVERVRSYICNQQAHHRRVRFEAEYEGLLAGNHIEFESRFLWR